MVERAGRTLNASLKNKLDGHDAMAAQRFGATYVSVRALAKAFDARYSWEPAAHMLTMVKADGSLLAVRAVADAQTVVYPHAGQRRSSSTDAKCDSSRLSQEQSDHRKRPGKDTRGRS